MNNKIKHLVGGEHSLKTPLLSTKIEMIRSYYIQN